MLDKALMQRIERKSRVVKKTLVLSQNDWEKTSYQLLAQNFGFKVNSPVYFKLSEAVPLKIMQKQSKQSPLPALFFGQTGLLDEEGVDPYTNLLKSAYDFLINKHSLETKKLEKHEWHYLRMRPAIFAPLRIAQFAASLHELPFFFSFFKEEADYKNLFKIHVDSSDYLPVHDEQIYTDRALDFMQNLPAENNGMSCLWKVFGFSIKNRFDCHAVIKRNNNFCSLRKCLECNFGTSLLKQSYK